MINKKIIKIFFIWKYGLILKKPKYISRLLFYYSKMLLFKNYTPIRGVDFAIDYACNLNCQHCFDKTLIKEGFHKKMMLQDYQKVAKEAMKLGCTYFGFQGGELFLRKDYLEIIKSVFPQKNRITVTSNGFIVDEKKIKELKNIGVDYMIFSVDSGIPEEHDKFRGVKGSYDKVMNAIKICKKLKMNYTINTTVSHFNIKSEGFEEIIKFAHKNNIMINTLYASPSGNWDKNIDILMSKEDTKYFLELRKKYPFIVRDTDTGFKGSGCPAVKEVLFITPYGEVLGCPFIHVSLGNVLKESLKKIREKGIKTKYYKKYHPKCLIAEDKEFIKNYFSYISEDTKLPIELNKTNW